MSEQIISTSEGVERRNHRPPSPPARPWFGHLYLLRDRPLTTFRRLSAEYGDVVEMRAGKYPIFLLNHPTDIERLLVGEASSTRKPELLRRTKETLGEGLLTSDGEYWKRQRRLATPAFRKGALEEYTRTMEILTERTVGAWREEPPANLHHEMMELTLRIVSSTLFGTDIERRTIREVGRILDIVLDRFLDYQTVMWVLFDWVPRPRKRRFNRALGELDRIIYDIIDNRIVRGEKDSATLLDRYAEAVDEDGTGMSRQALRDEVTTLFLAGHETTANALTFTFWLLARNPRIAADLHDEIRADPDTDVTVDSLREESLLRGVINESLRLYPPAWRVGRELTSPMELGGFEVPAGSQVFASQWSVHRDRRWFIDPDTFRPDRWLSRPGGQPPESAEAPRYAYFPFGGGPRLCIGSRFAELEMMVVLRRVLSRYRPTTDDPADLPLFPTITLRPAAPVSVDFIPW